MARPLFSTGTRVGLGAASAALAALWAWAACVLPWRSGGAWSWLFGALALAHVALAASAAAAPGWLPRVWRGVALVTLAAGCFCLLAIAWTCVSVVKSHGALGWGLSALLGVIAVLVAGASAPLGVWGLWSTRARHEQR